MNYMPPQIISRIRWCRLQQNLRSLTPEEYEGWRAEEWGLVDALLGRERTEFTNDRCSSQFSRYQSGLHDGCTLLCVTRPSFPNDQTDGGARQVFSRYRPVGPTAHRRISSPVHVEKRS